MSSNAVKFLSSQIPYFNGTEDDDVELWIEKIETVAELHSLSSVIMLMAVTSKLPKTVRRWFNLSTVPMNHGILLKKKLLTVSGEKFCSVKSFKTLTLGNGYSPRKVSKSTP